MNHAARIASFFLFPLFPLVASANEQTVKTHKGDAQGRAEPVVGWLVCAQDPAGDARDTRWVYPAIGWEGGGNMLPLEILAFFLFPFFRAFVCFANGSKV